MHTGVSERFHYFARLHKVLLWCHRFLAISHRLIVVLTYAARLSKLRPVIAAIPEV
jgi:hypothetical protein